MSIKTDPQTALRLADKALARLHPARDEAQFVAACYRRTDARQTHRHPPTPATGAWWCYTAACSV